MLQHIFHRSLAIRALLFALVLATLACAAVPVSATLPEAEHSDAQPLQRGINLGNALEAPNFEGEWGMTIDESFFDRIADAGFDFVRVPISWSTRAAADAPYTIDEAFFARVDEVVDQALARNLSVIINVHHYNEIMDEPDAHVDRLIGLWEQLAPHYADAPQSVYFELLNEPSFELDAARWNAMMPRVLDTVRATNPTRTVIVGPIFWNDLNYLDQMQLPDDNHLLATIHYYEPFEFTHQGAEWINGSDPWVGTEWTGSETEKAAIRADFDRAAEWAEAQGVPMLLGEFGVYNPADLASRARWTEFVRQEAEARGFSWAYWEFGAGFGAYDRDADQWREDLLRALIPTPPTAETPNEEQRFVFLPSILR